MNKLLLTPEEIILNREKHINPDTHALPIGATELEKLSAKAQLDKAINNRLNRNKLKEKIARDLFFRDWDKDFTTMSYLNGDWDDEFDGENTEYSRKRYRAEAKEFLALIPEEAEIRADERERIVERVDDVRLMDEGYGCDELGLYLDGQIDIKQAIIKAIKE